MWWLLIGLIVVALIVWMVMALNRRGAGDPNYRPEDPRHGEQLGSPGGGEMLEVVASSLRPTKAGWGST